MLVWSVPWSMGAYVVVRLCVRVIYKSILSSPAPARQPNIITLSAHPNFIWIGRKNARQCAQHTIRTHTNPPEQNIQQFYPNIVAVVWGRTGVGCHIQISTAHRKTICIRPAMGGLCTTQFTVLSEAFAFAFAMFVQRNAISARVYVLCSKNKFVFVWVCAHNEFVYGSQK